MKRTISILFILTLIPVIIICIVLVQTPQPNSLNNNFNRKYNKQFAEYLKSFELPFKIQGIAGSAYNQLFFSTLKSEQLLSIRTDSLGLSAIKLLDSGGIKNSSVDIQYPFIYIFDGERKRILISSLLNSFLDTIIVPGPIFSRGIAIDKNSFLIRQYISHIKDQRIITIKVSGSKNLSINNIPTELHYDSGMSTDGMFAKDEKSKLVVYVNFKNNNFQVFDSNLKLVHNAHTLDTFGLITARLNKKTKVQTSLDPEYVYNSYCCADSNKLYIFSKLKADNETRENFKGNCNIDVYQINPSKYLYSFYLPRINQKSITCFKVTGNTLIAVYEKSGLIYKISP